MMRYFAVAIILLCAVSAHAWTTTQTFEGYENNAELGLGSIASIENPRTGSLSAKVSFATSDANWGFVIDTTNATQGEEVWARAYYYLKSSWSWECSPVVKVLRNHIYQQGGSNRGHISLFSGTTGNIVSSNEVAGTQDNDIATKIHTDDTWVCLETYVKLGTGTDGIFRVWKDGILIVNETGVTTLGAATDYLGDVYFFTYWNGDPPQAQVAYIDDIIITNEQPANQDASGNYMIGPSDWGASTPPAGNIVGGSIMGGTIK
jgi:hypothetical protein